MLPLPKIRPPVDSAPPAPALPVENGCDTSADKFYKAWSRQHAGIHIAEADAISDQGAEIYSLLKEQGIGNLLVMGVHTNVCVLKRSFAIRQMTKWGIRCVLVRDLTDTMYDPNTPPHVPHDQGTKLAVHPIETASLPTTLPSD